MDSESFGSCRKTVLNVEFNELMSTFNNIVYTRYQIPPKEAECLVELVKIDDNDYNLKTCLEAAAKTGKNQ